MRLYTWVTILITLTSFKSNSQHELKTNQLKEKVFSAYKQKLYQEADILSTEVLSRNPYDNEIIHIKGQIAYYQKHYSTSIGYFQASINQGYHVDESHYNIACCYALDDKLDQAFEWLKKAIKWNPSYYYQWQDDSDLEKLRNTSKYLDKLYDYNRDAKTQNEKWISDINFFSDRIKQFHYDPFQHIAVQEWDKNISKLKSAVPTLEDHEIIVKLMELATLVGDGHTLVAPPLVGSNTFHQAPFLTYVFQDGIYIIEAKTDYKNLLGAKIVAIDDTPIKEVIKRLETVIPHDNEFGIKWLLPLALSMPEILHALKITSNKLKYKIQIEKKGKLIVKEINCDQTITGDFLESWLYGFHKLVGWLGVETTKLPSYRSKTDIPYWFEYLKKDKIVFFHYNQVQTNPEESEGSFIQKLNDFIENNEVNALVIDLRSNEGGDNTIYRPILNGIISNSKVNQIGKLYAIIGRSTFSAGMCFAAELEKSTTVQFIGEPTGSSPNFVGESGGVFKLPFSGIYSNASNLFWQNSFAFDKRRFIVPQQVVELKFTDYLLGIDAPMEIIKELIVRN